jgi:hypothetical protein
MSHHEDLLGRAAYYLQKALDSKSIRQAADMLELAYFFKRMAYDVRALEMARWPSSPASSPQPMRRRHLDESIGRWRQRSAAAQLRAEIERRVAAGEIVSDGTA